MKTRMLSKTLGVASLLVLIPVASQTLVNAQPATKDQPGKVPGSPMERGSQPGMGHKKLEPLVGSWDVSGQCWDKPGESPQSITGKDDSEWVLGGRFVQCHANGSKGSTPFEGIGMLGYDNAQRKYVASWHDTESTGIKTETGTYDSATKTFTFVGESKDENGQTVKCRRVMRIDSNDQHTVTAYVTPTGGTETKAAELVFKRTTSKP